MTIELQIDLILILVGITISIIYLVSPLLRKLSLFSDNTYVIMNFFMKILWIYSALTPTFILIFIRFQIDFNCMHLLILLPLIIQLSKIALLIRNNDNLNKGNSKKLVKVKDEFHSAKLMEYFVTLVLPFITLSNNIEDKLTIILILMIISLVYWKLELYYLNLPILLFYNVHFVVLPNNKNYTLISAQKYIENNQQYNIIILNENLKIAILVKNKTKAIK